MPEDPRDTMHSTMMQQLPYSYDSPIRMIMDSAQIPFIDCDCRDAARTHGRAMNRRRGLPYLHTSFRTYSVLFHDYIHVLYSTALRSILICTSPLYSYVLVVSMPLYEYERWSPYLLWQAGYGCRCIDNARLLALMIITRRGRSPTRSRGY